MSKVITDLAVFEFHDRHIVLTEIAEGVNIEEVRHKTECAFDVVDNPIIF